MGFPAKNNACWHSLLGLWVGLSLVLAACGPAATEVISPIATPSGGGSAEDEAAPPGDAVETFDVARRDLAEQLGISEYQIVVVEAKAVDWPDASLGCPRPGMVYAQVVTPGYEIVLEAEGQVYAYHTGGNRSVLCEEVEMTAEPARDQGDTDGEALDPQAAALVEEAKEDLSTRLKVALDRIALKSAQAVRWRDSSLGCPQPGMNYLTVITPGYLIKLEASGRVFEYHASTRHVVFCDHPQPPLP